MEMVGPAALNDFFWLEVSSGRVGCESFAGCDRRGLGAIAGHFRVGTGQRHGPTASQSEQDHAVTALRNTIFDSVNPQK